MERPTCTVALIFQYECSGGEKRTDKGGKATLFKRGNRLFLLTVKQVATYSEIRPNTEKLLSVTIPFLRAIRGEKKLTYKNVIKDVPIPTWTPVDVSDEDPNIPVGEDKFLNLTTHDSIYWLEVTKEAWAASPLYTPPQETTVNISLGENVRFGSQRRMGTGFLSEFPQWRSIREIEGKSTHYPGEGNQWYSVNSPFQVPPTNNPDCKGAAISFSLPSSILTDWCYYPPMFLLDVNIKNAAVGWPVLNDQNELIGLVSQPMYVMDTKDVCFPGTWICAVPAGLEFPSEEPAASAEGESADAPAEGEGETSGAPTQQKKPKKSNKPKKKKGKGKRK